MILLLFLPKIQPLLLHHDRPIDHAGVDVQDIFAQQSDEEQLKGAYHIDAQHDGRAAGAEAVPPDQLHDQIDQGDQQADAGGEKTHEGCKAKPHFRVGSDGQHGRIVQAVEVVFRLARPAFFLAIGDFDPVEAAPVLRHDSPQKGAGIVQFPEEQDEASVIEAESREVFDEFRLGHGADQPVVYGAQEIDEAVFPAGSLDAADDSVSLFPLRHEFWNHIHRVLEIRAQEHGAVPVRLAHPVEGGVELPEIGRVENRLDLLISSAQFPQLIPGAVRGAVVDEKDLIIVVRQILFHHFDDCCADGADVFHFVKARYDDADFLHVLF